MIDAIAVGKNWQKTRESTEDVLHRWCHIALWSSRRPSEIERRAMAGEQAPWNWAKSGSTPGLAGNKRLTTGTHVAMDAPDIRYS